MTQILGNCFRDSDCNGQPQWVPLPGAQLATASHTWMCSLHGSYGGGGALGGLGTPSDVFSIGQSGAQAGRCNRIDTLDAS